MSISWFKTDKPGILTRLSNLIVLQVLFIFAALALILSYPNSQNALYDDSAGLQELIRQVSQRFARLQLDAPVNEHGTGDTGQLASLAECGLPFSAMTLYEVDLEGTDQLRPLDVWVQSSDDGSTDSRLLHAAWHASGSVLAYVAEQSEGFFLSTSAGAERSIVYSRLPGDTEKPLVLTSVLDQKALAEPVGKVRYALFLLFLFSALVALLTIHLISKRLKRPMDRLIHGLEKTTQGELYYLVESDGDKELKRLSGAFNTMTRTLWMNQKALREYNARLKKTNVSLIDSQIFLSTLINSSPLSIIVTSADGRIMLCNSEASKEFSRDSEELVGSYIQDLISISSEEDSAKEHLSSQRPGVEALCLRADGEYFPAYVIVSPIQTGEAEPRAFLYLLNDITESKNFQEMMIRLDRNCTLGEMAGDIAHEINNYLAILSGNLELLPVLLNKGKQDKVDQKLDLMRTTVDKITHFANGLMDTPQNDVNFEMGSMNQVVENVIAFLKPQNKYDCIKMTTNLASDIPLMEFDHGQVQQLLVNLIYNAADAMRNQNGHKEVKIRTILTTVEGKRMVRVEIHDNGPGVREDKVESLFKERFTTRRKGHGIGLITCRKIVDAHSGKIGYTQDNGAKFYFEIPIELHRIKPSPETVETNVVPS